MVYWSGSPTLSLLQILPPINRRDPHKWKPILNIIDNMASKEVQAYLEAEKVNIQLVEPHNHRVNAAERAIQTFKNHLIARLSTCDARSPSLLWNKIVPQA